MFSCLHSHRRNYEEELARAIFKLDVPKSLELLRMRVAPLEGNRCLKRLILHDMWNLFVRVLSIMREPLQFDLVYYACYNDHDKYAREMIRKSMFTDNEYKSLLSSFVLNATVCAELAKKTKPPALLIQNNIMLPHIQFLID